MNAISTVNMIREADSKARSIRKSRPHATLLYAYAVVLALCHHSAVVAGDLDAGICLLPCFMTSAPSFDFGGVYM